MRDAGDFGSHINLYCLNFLNIQKHGIRPPLRCHEHCSRYNLLNFNRKKLYSTLLAKNGRAWPFLAETDYLIYINKLFRILALCPYLSRPFLAEASWVHLRKYYQISNIIGAFRIKICFYSVACRFRFRNHHLWYGLCQISLARRGWTLTGLNPPTAWCRGI